MKFHLYHEGILELSSSALTTLKQFKQLNPGDKEAGGMLLGRMIDGSHDVIIDEVTLPHSSDPRTRFAFFRKKEPAQKVVNKAWSGSKGTKNYLGEWHTHPEPFPNPSNHDLINWDKISKEAKYDQIFLIFIIVGTADIRAWGLSGGNITRLEKQ